MSLEKVIKFILKKKFPIGLVFIIIIGFFLRFYNYGNRWGLGYDQARDLLVASFAVHNSQIPLIGPFSSAGAFVYGPQWFFILMIFLLLPPYLTITPWIFQSTLYVLMIPLMFLIGKELENKYVGIIAAFFISISTAQIAQSTNLTSPSMCGIFSLMAVLFFIRYIKKGTKLNAFLMAFFVATSINIHFQAIGLLILLPVALVFGRKNIQNSLLLILGTLIPFIPLIIFDIRNNFYESRNLIDYYLYGQHKVYNPNRWLTYAGVFWPNLWARIIGGISHLGYLMIIILFFSTFISIIKKKISKQVLASIVSFLAIFIMLRYYNGARFESYFVFLHPFVIVLSAWSIYRLFKYNYVIPLLLILVITFGSLKMDFLEISSAQNLTSVNSIIIKDTLIKTLPNQKFFIYDFNLKTVGSSFPLVLYLENENKISDKGIKIGFSSTSSAQLESAHNIVFRERGFYLFDLNSSSSSQLSKEGWDPINPSAVYNATENWYEN